MHYSVSIGTGAGVFYFTTHSKKDVRRELEWLPAGWSINIWEYGKKISTPQKKLCCADVSRKSLWRKSE